MLSILAMDWTDYTRFGITLFALINPFTKIPYCLSVCGKGDTKSLAAIAVSSTVSMTALLLLMHFAGEVILVSLGTTLASFQIGGGLVIVLTGLALMGDEGKNTDNDASSEPLDFLHAIKIGVAPLGIPMLAGAGSIAKVMTETHPEFGIQYELHITLVIVTVCLISGIVIASGGLLSKILGSVFFSIIGRLSGLIVVAVGVEVVWRGLAAHIATLR